SEYRRRHHGRPYRSQITSQIVELFRRQIMLDDLARGLRSRKHLPEMPLANSGAFRTFGEKRKTSLEIVAEFKLRSRERSLGNNVNLEQWVCHCTRWFYRPSKRLPLDCMRFAMNTDSLCLFVLESSRVALSHGMNDEIFVSAGRLTGGGSSLKYWCHVTFGK
ncbi:hypothetical protein J6590_100629, partial [Homalodisca vitripennis]